MLIGHEQPWEIWRAAMAGQRMHHGWLLAGREGLGKASFALEAAAALVAEPGVAQPAPHQHPDILVLEPLPANDDEAKKRDDGRPYARKRNINVEQIRTMLHRLHTRPTLGARRAVIVDAADHLEKGAVNALLKGLEEPPRGTFFLLVVHQLGRLLPTVRSRCQVLRFRPLEPQEMDRAVSLAAPELDAETRSAAIAVAHGSPGAALMFAAHDLGRPLALLRQILGSGDPDLSLRAELGNALGSRPDRERLLATIEAARTVLTEALAQAGADNRLKIIAAHQHLVDLAREVPTHNFEPALLVMEIGGLLARAARTRAGATSR